MGSACGALEETVEWLNAAGEKVGVLQVRLYRPFDAAAFLAALPPTRPSIAVLDRTKEPGALGEPLYQDVVTALRRAAVAAAARSAGCRGSSAGATACRPRSSRRPWPRRSSTSSRRPEPKHALHRRHRRRRHAPEPRRSSPVSTPSRRRRRPRRLLRARRRRHGGREQELGQDHRRGHRRSTPRATSSTTRRSRARRPSRTCGSARGRSGRRT